MSTSFLPLKTLLTHVEFMTQTEKKPEVVSTKAQPQKFSFLLFEYLTLYAWGSSKMNKIFNRSVIA